MWLVLIEVIAETGDPAGSKIGFLNVTTWADAEESARIKIQQHLESHGWHLVSFEKAHRIEANATYGEEVAHMIERTRTSANAIILGTFHAYKTN